MSVAIRVFEKSAMVLAFIQKTTSISTENEGKGKKLFRGGEEWGRKED